jgi:hypothetical protein
MAPRGKLLIRVVNETGIAKEKGLGPLCPRPFRLFYDQLKMQETAPCGS